MCVICLQSRGIDHHAPLDIGRRRHRSACVYQEGTIDARTLRPMRGTLRCVFCSLQKIKSGLVRLSEWLKLTPTVSDLPAAAQLDRDGPIGSIT